MPYFSFVNVRVPSLFSDERSCVVEASKPDAVNESAYARTLFLSSASSEHMTSTSIAKSSSKYILISIKDSESLAWK